MDWTHRLRLRQLQVLLSLADTQNISHSAEQLHVTQPALSKWLKEFETDLGLPLFERHARGLRLTAYGKTLKAFALRINGELDRARDEMAALRQGSAGRAVVGASGAAIASVVPQAIQSLLREMPSASIEIREAPMDGLFIQLLQHELDIAVGRAAPHYQHPEICSEPLYEERLRFAVRANHPLTRKPDVSLADLLSFRWIVWTRDIPARYVLEDALAEAGLAVPRDVVNSNSVLATIALATDSDMVAVVAERAIDLPDGTRVLTPLPVALHTRSTLTMYWRQELVPSAAVQELLARIRAAARPAPA